MESGCDCRTIPQKSLSEAQSVESTLRIRSGRNMSLKKKTLFAFLTATTFLLLLELSLAIVGVRPVLYEDDPYVGFSSHVPLFVETKSPSEQPVMETSPSKLRWFNQQQFLRGKPRRAYRIFCLGGSTTYGRPYGDVTSFCGWLRAFLPAADPSRLWEVINVGGISYASYRVARLMQELTDYAPDLFIIYCGHNEFLERRTYPHLLDTPEPLRGFGGLLSHTRTFAAMSRLMGNGSAKTKRDQSSRDVLTDDVRSLLDSSVGLDAYYRDDRLRDQVIAHYRFNVNRMVDIARSVHAAVLVVSPASNLRDCSPFKSEHRQDFSQQDRSKWQTLMIRARSDAESGRLTEALEAVNAALTIDDRMAEAHYLQGRLLIGLGRFDEAKASFVRARDEDVCPLRALTGIQMAVAEVATARGAPFLDFVRLVEDRSEHRIPGTDWFVDHVHPTIEGNRMLALAILEVLANQRIVHFDAAWNEERVTQISRQVESSLDPRAQAMALLNLSKVLGWAGKRDEADGLALRTAELIPDDSEAQYQAGNAFMRRGNRDEAEQRYRKSQRLDPSSALPSYGLGLVFLEKRDYARAVQHFERAVEIAPDFRDAQYNLGVAYEALGDLSQASQHYQTAHRLSPEDTDVLNNLGIVNAKRGQYNEAETWFRKAIQSDPRFARAYSNLGLLHEKRGETVQAAATYRKALEYPPMEINAARNLARILATSQDATLRNPTEAVQWAERAAEATDYTDTDILKVLVAAYRASGRNEAAEKWERQYGK